MEAKIEDGLLGYRSTDIHQAKSDPILVTNTEIAGFEYDNNGNRKKLKYYLEGYEGGDYVWINYQYNLDNMLTGFTNTGGPTFTLGDVTVDGLGRLKEAAETIAYPGQSNRTYDLEYDYDMRSQLTDASISDIDGYPWVYNYSYRLDGNIWRKILNESNTDYEYDTTPGGGIYDSDIMTKAGGDTLTWDPNNGWLTAKPAISFTYNWDGKLRSAAIGSDSISLKYDPMGNRVWRQSTVSSQTTTRKYIIDISGELPTILMEVDPGDSSLKKKYIYANGQILAQHDVPDNNEKYFYLHDRLGSVRLVIDDTGAAQNSYTYNPFGEMFPTECTENVSNPFRFTGQWFDPEIEQYYLRARMYDPVLMRFTARDPASGENEEPLTLHRYLYCLSNPINRTDPLGLTSLTEEEVAMGENAAIEGHGYGALAEGLRVSRGLQVAVSVYSIGLSLAAYGADNLNFDIICLGSFLQQLSALAYAWGSSGCNDLDKIVKVSRWGRPGLQAGDWVVKGGKNIPNYLRTMKWIPGKGFAAYSTGQSFFVSTAQLQAPTGALSFLDAVFGFWKYMP
jgi:RHS repeat-associated protein